MASETGTQPNSDQSRQEIISNQENSNISSTSSDPTSRFYFPEPPEKPKDSDCCGTGCTPCVFDIYEDELKLWRGECEKIKLRSQGIDPDDPKVNIYLCPCIINCLGRIIPSVLTINQD